MIINFGAAGIVKYFSVSWLSNYNESEYLFIQNEWWLQINNIVNLKSGREFALILKSLRILEKLTTGKAVLDGSCWRLTRHIIENNMKIFSTYAQKMISTYCMNKTSITIDFSKLLTYLPVNDLLFYSNYDWIQLTVFNKLFLNVQSVTVENIVLSDECFEDMLWHLDDTTKIIIVTIEY